MSVPNNIKLRSKPNCTVKKKGMRLEKYIFSNSLGCYISAIP